MALVFIITYASVSLGMGFGSEVCILMSIVPITGAVGSVPGQGTQSQPANAQPSGTTHRCPPLLCLKPINQSIKHVRTAMSLSSELRPELGQALVVAEREGPGGCTGPRASDTGQRLSPRLARRPAAQRAFPKRGERETRQERPLPRRGRTAAACAQEPSDLKAPPHSHYPPHPGTGDEPQVLRPQPLAPAAISIGRPGG